MSSSQPYIMGKQGRKEKKKKKKKRKKGRKEKKPQYMYSISFCFLIQEPRWLFYCLFCCKSLLLVHDIALEWEENTDA